MKTKYEQIVNVASIASPKNQFSGLIGNGGSVQNIPTSLQEVINLAEQENFVPAVDDAKKILLLSIDVQNDFMEDIGSLAVPGSKGDVERLTRWVYENMSGITQIMCSLDTHSPAQIFHPCWWQDENGNQPAPYTIITYDDVKNGKWKPVYGQPARSVEYLKHLEQDGKKQLCIWPYHCLAGSYGANLEGEFTKMVYFHSAARKSKPGLIQKGSDPYSEMYGIIKAEYDPNNFLNLPILNAMERFDEIYIAGEAASHCLMESGRQILEHFAGRPDITQRITILEDCTSPISGFEQVTKDAFESFKKTYGIKVMKSTDVKL